MSWRRVNAESHEIDFFFFFLRKTKSVKYKPTKKRKVKRRNESVFIYGRKKREGGGWLGKEAESER